MEVGGRKGHWVLDHFSNPIGEKRIGGRFSLCLFLLRMRRKQRSLKSQGGRGGQSGAGIPYFFFLESESYQRLTQEDQGESLHRVV